MIQNFIQTYGNSAVFVLVALESLGVPLPGEMALLSAGAFAAMGHLTIVGVILAAASGAIAGDLAAYWIGRTAGLALVRRYGRFWHLDESKLSRVRRFYGRHGGKTVFFGRFVSLLRMWAAVLAGVTRMRYGRFAAYNAAGGLCWATLVGSTGYALGRSLRLDESVGRAGALVSLLLASTVALCLLGWWVASQHAKILAWFGRQLGRVRSSALVRKSWARHPGAWTFIERRFSRTEYLGLHLTLGLTLSLGALWLFGGIAEDVIHHDPLTRFDLRFADLLHRHTITGGIALATWISYLGSPGFVTVWSLGLGIFLWRRREHLLVYGLVAGLAGGGILDLALKKVFQRPRPLWDAPILTAAGWSFPSGHAMGSFVAYGMLAYILVLHRSSRDARVAIVAAAALLVLAIGFTRLYLGVHYFSDVIAGYAGGTVWLAACVSGLEVLRRGRNAAATTPAG